jgi:hypothetical protein
MVKAAFTLGTPPPTFQFLAGKGMLWLMYGAGLLRSAHVLAKQDAKDEPRRRRAVFPGVALQVAMLAAMALEDAIKAVLAEKSQITIKNDALEFKGHDVKKLASDAGIKATPGDKAEKYALENASLFIATIGRYPLAKSARGQVVAGQMPPLREVMGAYTRLFFRAAEAMARAEFPQLPTPPKSPDVHVRYWQKTVRQWIAVTPRARRARAG